MIYQILSHDIKHNACYMTRHIIDDHCIEKKYHKTYFGYYVFVYDLVIVCE